MIHILQLQILFNFTVQYPTADSGGFMKKWPNTGSNIKKVLSERFKSKHANAGWPEQIEEVLALLSALPAKAGRNTKGQVLPFIQAVNKLLVHSDVKVILVSVSFHMLHHANK